MRVVVGGWAWIDLQTAPATLPTKLRAMLTIKRRKVGDHPGDSPKPLIAYAEREGYFGVPRSFFFSSQRQNHEIEYQLTEGAPWPGDVVFNKTLYEEQQQAADFFLKHFRSLPTYGGIAKCPTGWGKTMLASYLISQVKRTALVLLNKEFLLNQWKDELESTLEGVKVGVVQDRHRDIEGKHVVLAMMPTLASRGVDVELRRWPGFVISDEVHRVGADTWSSLIPNFAASYRLGLSATPRRRDNADAAFTHHIGPVVFSGKVLRLIPKVRRVWTHFQHKGPTTGPMQKILLLKALTRDKSRNFIINDQLNEAVRAGRKILVLSERVEHCATLEKLFRENWGPWGAQPKSFHLIAEDARQLSAKELRAHLDEITVTYATFQLVSEAFNYPPFDTVCLATPIFDAEQPVGRILRPYDGKKTAIVIDIRDDGVAFCKRFGEERDKYYDLISAGQS